MSIFDTLDAANGTQASPTPAGQPTSNVFDTLDKGGPATGNIFDQLDAGGNAPGNEGQPVAFGSFGRGGVELARGLRAGTYMLGHGTPEEFAKSLVESQKSLAAYPKTEEQKALETGLSQEGLGALLAHPTAIPSMLAESVPGMLASIPLAIGGGAAGGLAAGAMAGPEAAPVGAFAGTAAGVGIGAGATDYGNSIVDFMQTHGVNLDDEQSILLALNDNNFMNEAHWYAAKRAGISTAFNAAGAALGGKIATRFFTPETKLLSTEGAKGVAALGGVAAGTQAATSASQELATTGSVDPRQVSVDAFFAGLGNLLPMAAPGIGERIVRGAKRVKTEKDITDPNTVVDETGRPVQQADAGPQPTLPEDTVPVREGGMFSGLRPEELQMMADAVKASGKEVAKPEEWDNIVQTKVPTQDSRQSPVVPSSALETDAPVSRSDILRNIESQQIVVDEGEPTLRTGSDTLAPGETLVKPIFDRTLELRKELPMPVPQDGEVVTSTVAPSEPVARVEVSERSDSQSRRLLAVERVSRGSAKLDSNWGEVVVDRVQRWAAENGFEAVSWPRGEGTTTDVGVTRPLDVGSADVPTASVHPEPAPVRRMADAKRAERIVMRVKARDGNLVKLDAVETRPFADSGAVRQRRVTKDKIGVTLAGGIDQDLRFSGIIQAAALAVKALRSLQPKFSLRKPLDIIFTKAASNAMGDFVDLGTHYQIRIHLANQLTSANEPHGNAATSVYTTLWHEFGHTLAMDKWGDVNHSTQQAMLDAHQEYLTRVRGSKTVGEGMFEWRNPIKNLQYEYPQSRPDPLRDARGNIDSSVKYGMSFGEWFAEQVARWAVTSEKPLTMMENFFASLGRKIREFLATFRQKFPGVAPEAVPSVQTWMDAFVGDVQRQFNVGWFAQQAKSTVANLRALRKAGMQNVAPTPQTPQTTFARSALSRIMGTSGVTPQAAGMAAIGDRMSWMHRLFLSLPQIAALNKHIQGLQFYLEGVRAMHRDRMAMVDRATTTVKMWFGLGKTQNIALHKVIEDYADMTYLTPKERAQGVTRKPTQAELAAIVAQHGLSPKGLGVMQKLMQDFDFMLMAYQDNMIAAANRISDPTAAALRIAQVQAEITRMRNRPYFPWMRFGDYTLTIRDNAGKVAHFETFESERQRNAAAEKAAGLYPPNAFEITRSLLDEDVKPLLGMPPGLLDRIHDTLRLSPTQQKALEQLRFELAPGASFKHRFQFKKRVSGYSDDYLRAYGNYMFHGSSHIARTKYVDALESFISDVKDQADFMPDGTKRKMIGNYLSQHLAQIIDARSDFVKLKGMIFHFALGFNPAAAALNLSQQWLATLPFLGAKFGDIAAASTMMRHQVSLSTYYREATLEKLANTDFHYQALNEGIKQGIITEAMAPMLAGVSEGRNFGRYLGRKTSERIWFDFSKYSAGMFQMTEQMNRRVTFRAALDLAMRDPNRAHVQEVVRSNQMEYTRLRGEGWTHQQAAAFVTAADAVRATQYEYASYARPNFMQGKAGAVFIFKSFVQNSLFMLMNYPSVAVRGLLIMGFLGGLMGLPGSQDLSDVLKTVAFQFFGKDFDLEREARQFVHDVTNGSVDPSILLHGISREGYGLPAVMDMLGEHIGLGDMPMPTVDRSGSIGLGNILPVQLSPLFGPAAGDPNAAIAQTAQNASGAAFSVGFNIYRTLVDPQNSAYDLKRWERMMPTVLKNASRMYRVYNEGYERTNAGNPVQQFDVNDTEQMMEVLAMGIGYQPLALTSAWDRLRAIAEVKAFWQLRHDALLHQISEAYVQGDKEEQDRVKGAIKAFNSQLPQEAKGFAVTSDSIISSVQGRAKDFKILSRGGAVDKRTAGVIKVLDPLFPVEVGRKVVH